MILYWHGGTCVSLESAGSRLVTNPFSAEKEPKDEAGVVLLSESGKKHSSKTSFVINTPGEYDAKGFFVMAALGQAEGAGGNDNLNYIIEAEGIRICYFSQVKKELNDEQLEGLDNVDVLIIGAGDSRDDNEIAAKIVNQIEPRLAIPIGFEEKPTTFLKEMGSGDIEAQNKLTIKKKDLPQEETEIIVLKIT